MLFETLLVFHSFCRWAVLGITLLVGARCAFGWWGRRRWIARDATFGRAWVGVIDLQVSLGLLLYFMASPVAVVARRDLARAWADEIFRFFGILHPLAMLVAASVAHAAWIWTRRTGDEASGERFRRLGIGLLGTLLLVVLAIPWPFLPYGRPLVRG